MNNYQWDAIKKLVRKIKGVQLTRVLRGQTLAVCRHLFDFKPCLDFHFTFNSDRKSLHTPEVQDVKHYICVKLWFLLPEDKSRLPGGRTHHCHEVATCNNRCRLQKQPYPTTPRCQGHFTRSYKTCLVVRSEEKQLYCQTTISDAYFKSWTPAG